MMSQSSFLKKIAFTYVCNILSILSIIQKFQLEYTYKKSYLISIHRICILLPYCSASLFPELHFFKLCFFSWQGFQTDLDKDVPYFVERRDQRSEQLTRQSRKNPWRPCALNANLFSSHQLISSSKSMCSSPLASWMGQPSKYHTNLFNQLLRLSSPLMILGLTSIVYFPYAKHVFTWSRDCWPIPNPFPHWYNIVPVEAPSTCSP